MKDMRNTGRILFFVLLLVLILVLFKIDLHGQILETRANIIHIVNTSNVEDAPPQIPAVPQCTLLDKILEPDPEFDKIKLSVGTKDIIYYEEVPARDTKGIIRKDKKTGEIIIQKVKRRDPEREIALKILNLETGNTEVIKIIKKGDIIVSPPGYAIEVIQRPNGIRWNAYNTYYRIIEPANWVVIRNVWPEIKTVKGKKVIENKAYVPYSKEMSSPEIIQKGKNDLKRVVAEAKNNLLQNNVIIADVLTEEFYRRRAIMERADLGEMVIDPKETVDMFFAILATNEANAFSNCNSSGACGLFQFTDNGKNGTYRTVARTYPKANLIKVFRTGALDHINSAMAAMLLDNSNLNDLVKRYGKKIYSDPRLEEYLAASYNGAPRHVNRSLDATLSKNILNWGKYLKTETDGFLVKLSLLKRMEI